MTEKMAKFRYHIKIPSSYPPLVKEIAELRKLTDKLIRAAIDGDEAAFYDVQNKEISAKHDDLMMVEETYFYEKMAQFDPEISKEEINDLHNALLDQEFSENGEVVDVEFDEYVKKMNYRE